MARESDAGRGIDSDEHDAATKDDQEDRDDDSGEGGDDKDTADRPTPPSPFNLGGKELANNLGTEASDFTREELQNLKFIAQVAADLIRIGGGRPLFAVGPADPGSVARELSEIVEAFDNAVDFDKLSQAVADSFTSRNSAPIVDFFQDYSGNALVFSAVGAVTYAAAGFALLPEAVATAGVMELLSAGARYGPAIGAAYTAISDGLTRKDSSNGAGDNRAAVPDMSPRGFPDRSR